MLSQIKNNKRGISVMIGYVLLITFAIIMSIIVYNWLESYVPKDEVECEDGVSMVIEEYSCEGGTLNITLRNNGRFSVAGFTIFGKKNETADIATLDLSNNIESGGINASGRIYFSDFEGTGSNSFPPSKRTPNPLIFDISSEDEIPEIVITPVRRVEWQGKKLFAVCGRASIEETVNCGS